ncbi:MAG: carboxypeptidase regulatory-like domain-containing protein [Candidatus Jettenia sp.]|uniref:Carboxypeptidase regulatory-like domain-containing protein n=1 Tax=Candidatus Jettenia caeni TaxID=247490 RepID=I3IJI0_9BACT|nr:carboxypeptidase-like regulatory domain-containing protein [Candidatus Jettenia sp. AMX1]MBC6928931.1 carboxypeptidase regulatory-like domain-containing protein [Candidatus Jettenia sp.]WKZ17145.1 MAG: carboxypeptidase-like regulatory domain-containing protein [Candidatus Jettenia caeni]MDL1938391.1 carboxypeptidase regulatory-like domain-containing protein [Candidatus Jettenia sp. AMX1]GAB61875.1 hypothetical protein KSU1_C0279 [Candidatus Jettenia caeni]GIL19646.1 MAG: hypothetical protei
MDREMKALILGWIVVFLFCNVASAGALYGRIIQENGKPLAKTKVTIESKELITNEFGGYRVGLADGEYELNVEIHGTSFSSERIKIFSPETEQNWRIDHKGNRLIKIR